MYNKYLPIRHHTAYAEQNGEYNFPSRNLFFHSLKADKGIFFCWSEGL